MALASHTLILLSLFLLISLVRPQVHPLEQFRFLNNGDFGESTVEYGASYRDLGVIRNQFRLCFFNTTPNAFTLAIGMGTGSSDSIIRWVWQANPQNPVQEEASLSFGPEGPGPARWHSRMADHDRKQRCYRLNGERKRKSCVV
ncbi:unnamed protein product [Arabidopsis halleri]